MIQRMKDKIGKYEVIFFLLWFIIVAPKPLQLLLFIILIPFLLNRKSLKLDIISYLLSCYIIIYVLSVTYNAIKSEHDFTRILASLNNLLIWIVGLLFYLIYKHNKVNLMKITKISFYNFVVLFFLYLLSIFMYNIMKVPGFSLLNKALFTLTWFDNSNSMRFTGLMEYANLIVMFYFLFYLFFLKYLHTCKLKVVYKIVLLILSGVTFLATLSRSGIILLGLALLITFIVYYVNKFKNNLFASLSLFILSLILFLSFYTEVPHYFVTNINELLNSRDGSTETRALILSDSFNIANDNSPLIGMGIKAISPYDGLPYGSHSTYVGAFYKTGYIGLILVFLVVICSNLKMVFQFSNASMLKKSLTIFSILMTSLFFVEDIDGANWLIVFYFILNGIIQNRKNWRESL